MYLDWYLAFRGSYHIKEAVLLFMVLPRWHRGKEPACQCGEMQEMQFLSLGQEDSLE